MPFTLEVSIFSITFVHWAQIVLLALYALVFAYILKSDFKKGFILLPIIAFSHRLNFTLFIGETSKTIQLLYPIIPVLFVKGLLEYRQVHPLKALIRQPIVLLGLALLATDFLTSLFATYSVDSLLQVMIRSLNYIALFTGTIWWILVHPQRQRPYQTVWRKPLVQLVLAFILVIILNTIISAWQFADCSIMNMHCTVWQQIDNEILPNNLLPVGHQYLTWNPLVIRPAGLFGDINFNGFFIAITFALLLSTFAWTLASHTLTARKINLVLGLLLVLLLTQLILFIPVQSRSAILGGIAFACSTGVTVYYLRQSHTCTRKRIKPLLSVFLVTSLLLIGLGSYVLTTTRVSYNGERSTIAHHLINTSLNRFINPSQDSSAQTHGEYIKEACKLSRKNNFMPWGIDQYAKAYQQVIDNEAHDQNPHSTYAIILVEQGLPGLIIYVVVFILILYLHGRFILKQARGLTKGKRHSYHLLYTLMTIWAAALLPFLFLATTFYYGIFLPMWWWLGSPATNLEPVNPDTPPTPDDKI